MAERSEVDGGSGSQPMSILSCLMYVLANVVLMVMLWIYHRSRHRQQLVRREDGAAVGLDDAFVAGMTGGPSRHVMHSSILSVFGLHENRTFFSFEDHFSTFEEVADACKRAGLEQCQLIVGVDFSASNEWQGRKTFNGHCLHKLGHAGKVVNPYQKVIATIGRTLEHFDQDSFIPAFGFADKETKSDRVFPFTADPRGCQGFSEVLERYDRVAARVNLGGPTNFAPIVREAIRIVEEKRTYHILIIIADGQVNEYGPTVDAIVDASAVPLSIIVVGVGDGPWDAMELFDDRLPQRRFDNFQFVNYHKVTSKKKNPDTSLALHVLMEIPDQFKTIKSLGYLERVPAPPLSSPPGTDFAASPSPSAAESVTTNAAAAGPPAAYGTGVTQYNGAVVRRGSARSVGNYPGISACPIPDITRTGSH